MKKLLLTLAVLLGFLAVITSGQALAQGEETSLSPSQPVVSGTNSTSDVPAWLQRTSFAAEASSDSKPNYYFETVQPLLGTEGKDLVFFNQSRVSQKGGRPTFNTGVGVRKILGSYLLGLNTFYDYQDLHRHSRGGIGAEYLNDDGLEARVNSYIRISNERLVGEDTFNQYYEKVANGFDWEVGAPIPGFPMVKVYGGGEWYDFEHFKNKYGWKLRAEAKPTPATRINFETFDDTKRNKVGCKIEGAITLRFTSFDPQDIFKDIFTAKSKAGKKIDLYEKTLDRVVRNFDITVIKSTKSKATGLTVEGGRL